MGAVFTIVYSLLYAKLSGRKKRLIQDIRTDLKLIPDRISKGYVIASEAAMQLSRPESMDPDRKRRASDAYGVELQIALDSLVAAAWVMDQILKGVDVQNASIINETGTTMPANLIKNFHKLKLQLERLDGLSLGELEQVRKTIAILIDEHRYETPTIALNSRMFHDLNSLIARINIVMGGMLPDKDLVRKE